MIGQRIVAHNDSFRPVQGDLWSSILRAWRREAYLFSCYYFFMSRARLLHALSCKD